VTGIFLRAFVVRLLIVAAEVLHGIVRVRFSQPPGWRSPRPPDRGLYRL
jgi:hypothetical protein